MADTSLATTEQRPSPEALLEAARRRGQPAGRLTVFLGPAAGVGKTYAMLLGGRARHRARGAGSSWAGLGHHGRARDRGAAPQGLGSGPAA